MSENTTNAPIDPAHVDLEPNPSPLLVNIVNALPYEKWQETVEHHQEMLAGKARELGSYTYTVSRYRRAGLDPEAYQNKLDTLLAEYEEVLQAHMDLVAARDWVRENATAEILELLEGNPWEPKG